MNKIFLHAFANIRKTKGHTVSLFFMFLISALLLNAGLLVFINFGSFFDKLTKELNTSDAVYLIPNQLYNSKIDEFLENNDNITELQIEEPIWVEAKTKYNDENSERNFLLNDAEMKRDISKWKFIGKHLSPEEMSIYVPYMYQLKDGYRLNDKFILYIEDIKLEFTIKGFSEDVFFNSNETGSMSVYLPHETFEKVSDELGVDYNAKLIFTDMKIKNKDIGNGIKKLLNKVAPTTTNASVSIDSMYSMDKTILKSLRILMANMVSIMIVVFAAIIVAVCLIVVKFRIGNSIEDDMAKIGSMKAIGYTSRQIIWSIVTQFSAIAFAGSIVGITLSYLVTPFLSDVFEQQSGLKWIQGFDGKISSVSLCFILLFVVIISLLSTNRIKKIYPIVALRGGIVTHSFRKNHIPLDKSKGNLSFIFALKSILQNKKQSIMITIILLAVSFGGSFAVIMFYNTTVDITAFKETPGIEIANAVASLNPDTDNTDLIRNIENMSEVRKVQYIDMVKANLGDNDVYVTVMEDYSKKETDTVYQGRNPIHSNEIVLAGYLADMLNKKIGDNVILTVGDTNAKYMITGLANGANMGGMLASITYDGMMELNPKFKQQHLQIYLNKGTDADEYVSKLKEQYGDSMVSATDLDEAFEEGTSVYTSIVSKVGIVMLTVTILVVILVLYFVINSSVTRRKRELGIQKALGFTTFQLMNQISLGFLPPVTVGVIIGSYLGVMQGNNIMSIAQRSMGIMKANYIILPAWITVFGAAIVLISYITSMLVTYRIKKISAYALVSE